MLTELEQHQLLVGFNDTTAVYPKTLSVIDLFENQVSSNPTAIALVFGKQQVSYGELNERANKLAYYLNSKDIGAEKMVPLCIARGPRPVQRVSQRA